MAKASGIGLADEFDLYYLIERFLSKGPLQHVAQMMRNEMSSLEMIPKRRDWKGGSHHQSFDEFQQNQRNVQPDHLLRICTRIAPLLEKYVSPSIFFDSSLAKAGRRSSLLRNLESVTHTLWNCKHFAASANGLSLTPPSNLQSCNRIHVIRGREIRQSRYRKLMIPVSSYNDMKMCLRCLGHLSSVYCVLFDRTGTKIFTGSDDCLIKCWCVWSGRLLFTFRGHQAEICDMDVSFDNRLLAGGSCNKIIRVWNLQTAAPVAILQGHTATLTSLEFSPVVHGDIRYLVSTGRDGNVCFWKWNANTLEFFTQPIKFQERNRPGVSMLCSSWSGGGRFVAVGGSDYTVYIYYIAPDLENPCRLSELALHTDKVDSIWFAHNGLQFASGSCDGTARLWKFEKDEWKSSCLNAISQEKTDNLGQSDKNRIKVVMVAWDCHDKCVFTSLTDFTIKVWNSDECVLKGTLKGHTDDAYCLEGHPFDERILLSAGHDGNVFLWDVISCSHVMQFYNMLEGQGHGAVFDAKFSPNGDHVACTDSHGHLLIFSCGSTAAYKRVPEEQFFHTDYRPLIHDSFGSVLDEQTQQAPHRMPPPFLVDVDGNPHPAELQRLVPGREHLTTDCLLPVVAVGENGLQEVLNVSDDSMPNNYFQSQEGSALSGNDQEPGHLAESLASPMRNVGVGLRREGEVAGVRRMHINAPRSQMASDADLIALGRRMLVTNNLSQYNRLNENFYKAKGDYEIMCFKLEKQNCVKALIVKEHKISPISTSRRGKRVKPLAVVTDDEDEIVEADNDSASSSRLRPSRFVNRQRHMYGTRSNVLTESAESGLDLSDEEIQERCESEPSSESCVLASDSDCSTRESDEDGSWSSPHRSNESLAVAKDRRTLDIHKTRRKTRRKTCLLSTMSWEKNHSDDGRSNLQSCSSSASDVEHISIHDIESSKMSLKTSYGEQVESPFPIIPGLLPPNKYLPTKWIQQEFPRPSPYLPQIGDEVMYIREGHALYVKVVCEKKVWNIGDIGDLCYNYFQLKSLEHCQVVNISFEIGPPTLCYLSLRRLDEDLPDEQKIFSFRFHDMPDVIDFLVLKHQFDTSLLREWKEGDRFRSVIDDAWWYGTIISSSANLSNVKNVFQCLEVEWDSQEIEKMSPWDLEPIPDSETIAIRTRNQEKIKQTCGLPIATEEMNELFRIRHLPSDWWTEPHDPADNLVEMVDREISRIACAVETLLQIKMFFQFSGPVDLKVYPTYVLAIPYPIDLSLILRRLQSRYYRRQNALVWDINTLSKNALAFNKADSKIVKIAQILVSCLLSFIDDRECNDINVKLNDVSVDNQLLSQTKRHEVKCSKTKYSKRKSSRKKNVLESSEGSDDLPNVDDWKRECAELLSLVWDTEDAAPFREGVDEDEYPDYREYVDDPMDLKQVREKLAFGSYSSPKAVMNDICLMFNNSKTYNTNKKSKIYSMTVRLQALVLARMGPIITEWQNRNDTYTAILSRRCSNGRKSSKRLHRLAQVKEHSAVGNRNVLRTTRSQTLMNSHAGVVEDQPCSSKTASTRVKTSNPEIDSDSSGAQTWTNEEAVVTRSLRKRSRKRAMIDDASDDQDTSTVKKTRVDVASSMQFISGCAPELFNGDSKSSSTRVYEYDPDFCDNGIASPDHPNEDGQHSPITNNSEESSDDNFREDVHFKSHPNMTSSRKCRRASRKTFFAEDECEENDNSDDAMKDHDDKPTRLRSRRLINKKKQLRKSTRTNGRRESFYTHMYSELSEQDSDELSSDHVTSVSSRGRIRRMSTKAMESRIC